MDPLIRPMVDGTLCFAGTTTTKEIEAICDRYLENLHCTLWGSGYDVIHRDSRKRAARFLTATLVEALSEGKS